MGMSGTPSLTIQSTKSILLGTHPTYKKWVCQIHQQLLVSSLSLVSDQSPFPVDCAVVLAWHMNLWIIRALLRVGGSRESLPEIVSLSLSSVVAGVAIMDTLASCPL